MDPFAIIISGLIEKGGIWGIIAAIIFFWNIHKENKMFGKEKNINEKEKVLESKITQNQERCEKKINYLERELIQAQKELQEKTQENSHLRSERIEDLKKIIGDYHKLASDTSQTLEQIKFFLSKK